MQELRNMPSAELVSLLSMAALYILAGLNHFRDPSMYLKITPPWVRSPAKVNVLVGAIEIILALLLLYETTRSYSAIGIIVLLIAIFPANIRHYQLAKKNGRSVLPSLIRLPLQAILIYWSYTFISI